MKIGEEVSYIFPGRRQAENAIITKVRVDDENGEVMYDLYHKYNSELICKWISRVSIKLIPKEGDALMLANLEKKWIQELKKQRENEEKKMKKEKENAIAAEFAKLENMKNIGFRTNKENLLSTLTTTTNIETTSSLNVRIIRGRLKRIDLEVQEIREEIDRNEGEERRKLINDELAEITKGKYFSRSEILTLTRTLDMKIKINNKIKLRNLLREELNSKKYETLQRNLYIEDTLRSQEIRTTTPKSLRRRQIVRKLHIAMKRQEQQYMICDWGCGDWFKVGKEQLDHQLRRCVKRIIGCSLGCPLKHTEEVWLMPYEPSSSICSVIDDGDGGGGGDDKHKPGRNNNIESKSEIFYGDSHHTTQNNNKNNNNNVDNTTVGIMTTQQYHETEECPKRLVMCPMNCLEWIIADVLDKHLVEQCTKRPAKPIICRLGCGMEFGGSVDLLIQAEDDRLQHENEECNLRLVRCNFVFHDGRMCAAQMKACDRNEHRDYHITMQG